MSDQDLVINVSPIERSTFQDDPRHARRMEVVRSFSRKINLGNYESADFFCSARSECAVEDQAEVAASLYLFCRNTVLREAKEYRMDLDRQVAERRKLA